MTKYSNNEISRLIKPYKLIQYNNVKNIIASDDEGYKYKLTLSNLQMGRIPSKWMKNPYSIENLKLYLSINYPNYEWIDCQEYKGCKNKNKFICHNHLDKGIQENTFDNIINNHHVCKYCAYENLGIERRLDEEKIIELCNERNVIFCGRYTYNNESYIQYSCEKHSDKDIQVMSLTHFKTSKVPCRYCNVSCGELRVAQYLDFHNINYITQKTFKNCKCQTRLRFDFYLPDKLTCIEYDGQQHFMPVNFDGTKDGGLSNFKKTQERDNIKNQYCKDNNINLIRIPYWDYDNIEKILQCKI